MYPRSADPTSGAAPLVGDVVVSTLPAEADAAPALAGPRAILDGLGDPQLAKFVLTVLRCAAHSVPWPFPPQSR